jgi:hypothetical protein
MKCLSCVRSGKCELQKLCNDLKVSDDMIYEGERTHYEVDDTSSHMVRDIADLKANANTWRPVYRLARGNDIQVGVEKGTLKSRYPVVIEADAIVIAIGNKPMLPPGMAWDGSWEYASIGITARIAIRWSGGSNAVRTVVGIHCGKRISREPIRSA